MQLKPVQQKYFDYLQRREKPVTLQDMADKFNLTSKAIDVEMKGLLAAGLVTRKKVPQRRSVSTRSSWAFGYEAAQKKPKKPRKAAVKISYNNPFNIGSTIGV
jgi:predicted transcriptional regulator